MHNKGFYLKANCTNYKLLLQKQSSKIVIYVKGFLQKHINKDFLDKFYTDADLCLRFLSQGPQVFRNYSLNSLKSEVLEFWKVKK